MIRIFFLFLLASSLPLRAAHAEKILTPEGYLEEPVWTPQEQEAVVSKKLIKNTESGSYFWIRLKGAEAPHTHNSHDVIAVVVRGRVRVHLERQKDLDLQTGGVSGIPAGVVHWAENQGPDPALIYAVFNPPLEGDDYQPVEPKNT